MFNAACLAVSCVPSLVFSHEVGARQTPGKLTVCQDRRLFWGLTPESSALSESSGCPSPGMGWGSREAGERSSPQTSSQGHHACYQPPRPLPQHWPSLLQANHVQVCCSEHSL